MLFNRKKLSEYMKENGISFVDMGKRFGVSEAAIRHIITGIKQPSLAMAVEFAKMMGCTVDELIIKSEE